MRPFFSVGILFLISSISFSQEKAVDMLSINAGVIGAEIGYEKRLTDDFTLSGKLGYEMVVSGDDKESWFKMPAFVMTPTIGVEGCY